MSTPTAADFAALGIVLPTNPRVLIRTTCPQCSASRRKTGNRCLVVQADTGLFYCHHCGYKGKAGGPTSRPEMPTPRPPATPDEQHRRRLQRTWDAAHPLEPGDPVMRYLAQRGLTLPANQIPPALRYAPQLRYLPDDATEARSVHPGMVARIDDAQGRPINLHRTYLTRTGQKAAVADGAQMDDTGHPGQHQRRGYSALSSGGHVGNHRRDRNRAGGPPEHRVAGVVSPLCRTDESGADPVHRPARHHLCRP